MPRGIELDLSHQRFGKWTVLERGDLGPGSGIFWKCRCDCGVERYVKASALNLGESSGCGCDKVRTHGMSKTRTYKTWVGMKQRCTNHNAPDYPRYGGSGISICERWLSFDNFLADMGERPEGKSIDRIDNSGSYEPENCRWATASEQQFNKRFNLKLEYNGKIKSIVELSNDHGVPMKIIRWRLDNGWDLNKAVETPPISRRKS